MAILGQRPQNVSPEHYELSQIAKYVAWKWGCRYIANEVSGCYGFSAFEENPVKNFGRNVIDTIGIKSCYFNHSYSSENSKIKVYGFEAKVSYSDFKAGFCTSCEYTYIIAPIGIIPVTAIPKGIGLIEVDLQNYKIKSLMNEPLSFVGVNVVKKAKRTIERAFASENESQYQLWALNTLRHIAGQLTIDSIFKNPKVVIEKDEREDQK